MHKKSRKLLAGLLALGVAPPLQAAGAWQHEIAPYLFAAGMDGKAGVGSVTADVDVSFGDILDHLDWGGMVAYRATRGPWSLMADLVYMDVEGDKTGPQGVVFGDAEIQQTALEADVGYAFGERVSAFAGLRYNEVDADVSVRAAGPVAVTRSASGSETWLDPVIGARGEMPIGDQWSAGMRADIGGFGVGSDFAYQVVASLRWQATPTLAVIGAYRYFDQDYEDGSGSGYFKYDVAVSGPCLGVSFTF